MKKSLLFAILLLMVTTVTYAIPVATLTPVDPLQKILLEDVYFAEYDKTPEVARGETANYQLVVKSGTALSGLRLSVSSFRNDKRAILPCTIHKGFEHYVYNGNYAKTPAHDRINVPSSMYPDPIMDDQMASLPADSNLPVWLSVDISRQAQPGTYHATVTVTATDRGRRITLSSPIAVKVYPVTLEEPSLWMDNWFFPYSWAYRYLNGGKGVEYGTPLFWNYTRQLTSLLRRVYNNVTSVSALENAKIDYQDGRYTFGYARFDQLVDSFRVYGTMKMLEIGAIGGRVGEWHSLFQVSVPLFTDGTLKWQSLPMSDARTQDFLRQYALSITTHMREKYPDLPYGQKLLDEPIDFNADSYKEVAHFIKSVTPDLKILEAVQTDKLDNLVDIWVPQLNNARKMYDFLLQRQKAGDEIWFYTCLNPQGDYANRFLEQPLVKTRLLHWLNYRYGFTGYLHWGFNHWTGADPLTWHDFAGTILPGGDAWIVYPHEGRIYSSIRLEEMRRGVQDYTLLTQLAKKDKALADKLCASIILDWDRYDTSSAALNKTRHEMLEALK